MTLLTITVTAVLLLLTLPKREPARVVVRVDERDEDGSPFHMR
jgi:hypothetical protein